MSENTKKVNVEQKQTLVSFMQMNYTVLYGKFAGSQGRKIKEAKWDDIVSKLNDLGPPFKKVEQWKKSWLDMKAEVKKKLQIKRQNLNQSGAGPINIVFSELDERIIAICGSQLLDGDDKIQEIGFGSSKGMTSEVNDVVVDDISDECNSNLSDNFQEKYADYDLVASASKAKKRLIYESEESQAGLYLKFIALRQFFIHADVLILL